MLIFTSPLSAADEPTAMTDERADANGSGAEDSARTEAARRLREIGPFSALSQEALEFLASRCERRRVTRGTTLYEEGDRASMLAILVEGSVVLVREPLGHPIVRLGRLGPGSLVGGGEVWTADRRTATARAVEASTLLCLMREDLEELQRRAPDSALRLQLAAARQASTSVEGVLGAEADRIRYRLEVAVERREAGKALRHWLVDLSPGGLRLEGAPQSWEVGSRVDFELSTPVGNLQVVGRVAWREESQVGIALDSPWEDAESEAILRTLVATVRIGSRAPRAAPDPT